eukprot:2033925-Rhodomonas_salina.1
MNVTKSRGWREWQENAWEQRSAAASLCVENSRLVQLAQFVVDLQQASEDVDSLSQDVLALHQELEGSLSDV